MSDQAAQFLSTIIRVYQTEKDPGKRLLMELHIKQLTEKLEAMGRQPA